MKRLNVILIYLVVFVCFIVLMLLSDVDTSLVVFQPLLLFAMEVSIHFLLIRWFRKRIMKNRSLIEKGIELSQEEEKHIEDAERKYRYIIDARRDVWISFAIFSLVSCIVNILFDIDFILVSGANFATIILLCNVYGYVASWYMDYVHYSFEQFILDKKLEESSKEN